jgi:hypothetical protein
MFASTSSLRSALLRTPATRHVQVAGRISFHASALRAEAELGLEKQLRNGLKAAMKGKDKAAVTCLKVRGTFFCGLGSTEHTIMRVDDDIQLPLVSEKGLIAHTTGHTGRYHQRSQIRPGSQRTGHRERGSVGRAQGYR